MDRTQITVGLASLAAVGGIDMLAHLGPTGLVIGGIAAYVAYRHTPDVLGQLPEEMPVALPQFAASSPRLPGNRSLADRLLGRFPDEETPYDDTDLPSFPKEVDEDIEVWKPQPRVRNFSSMLPTFTPSLDRIYLATLADGTPVYSDAKGLCHVALAGVTGNGKSSLVRLLMSQLCSAGASVLLLNPHYTRYDIEEQEDWTPFEPYLVHDPMECRKYEVIEFYLKQVATQLLPKRLERYANSQPVGKPYYLVVDELPAIVKHIKDAPQYLADILREGRKAKIYLITSAQDFLVKTIMPEGEGAVRKCYRTACYVGGDTTTAKMLLEKPANQIPEDELGKGTIMLRCGSVKQAQLAHVPYVDNKALYTMLGPSTYVAEVIDHEDDLLLHPAQSTEKGYLQEPYSMPPCPVNPRLEVPHPEPQVRPVTTGQPAVELSSQLQRAYDVFESGMGDRAFGRALGVHHATAARYVQLLVRKGLIDENRQKKRLSTGYPKAG